MQSPALLSVDITFCICQAVKRFAVLYVFYSHVLLSVYDSWLVPLLHGVQVGACHEFPFYPFAPRVRTNVWENVLELPGKA